MSESWPLLVAACLYAGVCLLIGYYFRHRATLGVDDYYVARRSIPGWVVSLAFFSTFASTNTYIGQAGQAFASGLSWAWVGVIWTVFCMLSWLLLGPSSQEPDRGSRFGHDSRLLRLPLPEPLVQADSGAIRTPQSYSPRSGTWRALPKAVPTCWILCWACRTSGVPPSFSALPASTR